MPRSFRDIPPFPVNPFGVTYYVSNTTNPGEEQGSAGVTPRQQGRTPQSPYATIAAAITDSVSGRGDVVIIQRGTYTENLNFNKAGMTVIGAVPYGYPDHVIIAGNAQVNANGVSFYNLEFFSNSATLYCMRLGQATEANSVWFGNCSFASDGTTEPEGGVAIHGGNNLTFQDCYFIDLTYAIRLTEGLTSVQPTHLTIRGCHFLENTTADLSDFGGLTGTGLVGFEGTTTPGVGNLVCVDNDFGTGAVTPTDFINIASGAQASSGYMARNSFGSTTNASATITIPAGILYAANGTEAGWSTARPA